MKGHPEDRLRVNIVIPSSLIRCAILTSPVPFLRHIIENVSQFDNRNGGIGFPIASRWSFRASSLLKDLNAVGKGNLDEVETRKLD